MALTRVVVRDFENMVVGSKFEPSRDVLGETYGTFYGGSEENGYYESIAADNGFTVDYGTIDSPGYQSNKCLRFSEPSITSPNLAIGYSGQTAAFYIWGDGWGYRPEMNPPRLGRVCGMEVTFKVDPNSVPERESLLDLDMRVNGPSGSFSQIFFWFTSLSEYGGPGIWYAGASGRDTEQNDVGPGTTLFQGDLSDVMPVDLSRWLTGKLLPTGEWSLAYANGAVIMSGQLVACRDSGASISLATALNNPSGQGDTPNAWVDNVVFWLYSEDPPPPPPELEVGRLKVKVSDGTSGNSRIVANFEGGVSGAPIEGGVALPPFDPYKVWSTGDATYSTNSQSGAFSAELPAFYYGATILSDFTVAEVDRGIGIHVKLMPGETNQNWADISFTIGDSWVEILPHQAAKSTPNWDNILGYHSTMIAFEYTDAPGDDQTWGYADDESTWLGKWMDIRMMRSGAWSVIVDNSVIFSGILRVPSNVGDEESFTFDLASLGDGIVLLDDVYLISGPTNPWKYAAPKPGENDGYGRLRVKVTDTGSNSDWVPLNPHIT